MSRSSLVVLLAASSLLISTVIVAGCAAQAPEDAGSGEDAIVSSKSDDEWFYGGPLPQLENPQVTASLKGHTAHVTGLLPVGTTLPDLPHVKTKLEGGRTRIDVVYPIATASAGHSNARPGTYHFQAVRAYRPSGMTFTEEDGNHFVTWGGFPFIAYDGGIAFHGPITDESNGEGTLKAWFLKRGEVSHGCNRMMGEHVVELTHIVGVNMRKLYHPNDPITPTSTASVNVLADYDTYEGKFIDVDYPTDIGVVRPGKVHGDDNVAMFGSWVASETPDGVDLPPDTQWEGGVQGKLYVFNEHAKHGFVCSMPKGSLASLKDVANQTGGILPADFCTKKLACDSRLGRVCKVSEIGL
jgi:hypothetical protein